MTARDPNEPTVLIERSAFQELLRESRRTVQLAYLAGAIAAWSAVLLAIAEGGVTLWVGLLAILGVVVLAWGFRTARQLTRRYGPPGVTPTGGPFSPILYVDRQHSMWRETIPGYGGIGGDPGGGDAGGGSGS